jgi:hypothetical protein
MLARISSSSSRRRVRRLVARLLLLLFVAKKACASLKQPLPRNSDGGALPGEEATTVADSDF